MNIQKKAVCGTLSSNDVYVRVAPAEALEITIESPVYYEFGEHIEKIVREKLEAMDVQTGSIHMEDKGALDCTLLARLETAVKRAQ